MDFLRWCRNQWERSLAVATVVGGLVMFFLGWRGQRDRALVVEQIPYVVSGALFGLLLIVIGTTIWLSADLHDEWIKLDRFEETVGRAVTALEAADARAGGRSATVAHRGTDLASANGDEPVDVDPVPARGRRGGVSMAGAGE